MGWIAFDNIQAETPEHTLCKTGAASLPVRAARIPETVERTPQALLKRDERFLFVKTVWDYIMRGMNYRQAVRIAAGEVSELCPNLCHAGRFGSNALNYSNFRSWLRLLGSDENGFPNWENKDMLLDRYRGAPGRERPAAPEFWHLLGNYYLKQNRLSFSQSYKHAAADFRKKFPALPQELPDEASARYYFFRDVNAGILTYGREGETAFENRCGSYIRRDWSNVAPGSVWFADHREFDQLIRVPDENTPGGWRPVRPWLCAFTDARSNYFVGLRVVYEGLNHELIINTFGEAVNLYGQPDLLITDNGKDFKKLGFGTPVQYEPGGKTFGILDALGVEVKHTRPYKGRAKTVERAFLYIATQFDPLSPVYLGNRPASRPEIAALGYKPEYVMQLESLQQFSERLSRFIDEYHRTPQPGSKATDGLSPAEQFNRRPERRRWSLPELVNAFLLPERTLYKVTRGASIIYQKNCFFCEALWPYLGKKVIVKRDLQDTAHLFAFDLAGHLIGECRPRQTVAAIARTEEQRALLAQELKRQAGEQKTTRQTLRQICGAAAPLSPLEIGLLTPEQITASMNGSLKLEEVADFQSVKGGNHTNRVYRLPGTGAADEEAGQLPEPRNESKQERRRRIALSLINGEESQPQTTKRYDFTTFNPEKKEDEKRQVPRDL